MSTRKRAIDHTVTTNSTDSNFKTDEEGKEENSNGIIRNRGKPNATLTDGEKKAKRQLKKKLKVQQKIKKLETRIKHAIVRKDTVIEERTRLELEKLYLENGGKSSPSTGETIGSIKREETKNDIIAKQIILDISRQLHETFSMGRYNDDITNRIASNKEHQTSRAVELLRNMTKGTVDLSMFDDQAALFGYTRQKFYERALLLYTTMCKLKPKSDEDDVKYHNGNKLTDLQKEIKTRIWDKIRNGRIKKSCHIGCGPGNDCIGLFIFLYICSNVEMCINGDNLETSVMMDWSIDQWNSAVLRQLPPIMNKTIPVNSNKNAFCNFFTTSFCDVTKALSDVSNEQARVTLEKVKCDIYLTSYLLSETNGKWYTFFRELIQNANEECLFYFAEPTPWQLHILIEQFSESLDFLWVDSSMYLPAMQALDGRLGPAVLFAIKKKEFHFR